jgi:ABC-type nitrate/sulfonate/bicarbonate transport system substrate-binding protein
MTQEAKRHEPNAAGLPVVPGSGPSAAPMMDRRRFLQRGFGAAAALGAFAGAGGILAACGSSTKTAGTGNSGSTTQPSGARKSLTSAALQFCYLENVQFGGSFMALTKGYYKSQGLDVSFLAGGPNISVEPIVASGRALVGITHTANCIPALLNGAPLTIIGAGYQKNPNCIISKASAPITTPQDMLGKRIAVDPSEQPLFNAFAAANKLDVSKITVVTIGFDTSALISGDVDGKLGFVTNENIIVQLAGIPTAVLLLGDFSYPLMEELYIARTTDVDDPAKRSLLANFLRGEAMGWQNADSDPAGAAQLAVDVYGASQKLALNQQVAEAKAQVALVKTPDTDAHGLFWMTDENIDGTLASLALGGVKGKATYFTNQVLSEAYSNGPIT